MHPTAREEIMKAQVADMHRDAARNRLARAARRSRRTQAPARQPVTTSTPTRSLVHRLLAAVSVRTN
jgi:hypothetical protein